MLTDDLDYEKCIQAAKGDAKLVMEAAMRVAAKGSEDLTSDVVKMIRTIRLEQYYAAIENSKNVVYKSEE